MKLKTHDRIYKIAQDLHVHLVKSCQSCQKARIDSAAAERKAGAREVLEARRRSVVTTSGSPLDASSRITARLRSRLGCFSITVLSGSTTPAFATRNSNEKAP